jgi:hypothetical protein
MVRDITKVNMHLTIVRSRVTREDSVTIQKDETLSVKPISENCFTFSYNKRKGYVQKGPKSKKNFRVE